MKRVLRFLIYLYPAWWRRRYGRELEALLEDSGSRWRDVWDLFRGAMEMQMSKWTFGAIVLACGIAGLALAGAAAFAMPYQYRSTAILKMETPQGAPADPDDVVRVAEMAFTQGALRNVITDYHLYDRELTGAPTDKTIDVMRRAIRVEPAAHDLVKVSFGYKDPTKAQQVSKDLVSRIISANLDPRINQNELRIQLTTPPDPPKKVGEGKRLSLAHLGFPAGMLFGVVLALILRRRRARAAN